jgi:hypothetical protein
VRSKAVDFLLEAYCVMGPEFRWPRRRAEEAVVRSSRMLAELMAPTNGWVKCYSSLISIATLKQLITIFLYWTTGLSTNSQFTPVSPVRPQQ